MKQLLRPKSGRKLAGVCLALANYFSIDVTLVRIVFVFLLLPGGFPGLLPYALLWILIPEEA
jgi:phage shock protein C